MPAWLDDYEGEPIHVKINGRSVDVMRALMPLTNEYVVLAYRTDAVRAAKRVVGELRCADTLVRDFRPLVLAAVETNQGLGRAISYGDHPVKNRKKAMLADIKSMTKLLSHYASFAGVSLHDGDGWRQLK